MGTDKSLEIGQTNFTLQGEKWFHPIQLVSSTHLFYLHTSTQCVCVCVCVCVYACVHATMQSPRDEKMDMK